MGGVPLECSCAICSKIVYRTKGQINSSKSGNIFCSNKCVGKYNAIQRKIRIPKTCLICEKKYEVVPSRSDSVTCSYECQAKWQSSYLVGEKANNFKGRTKEYTCQECHKKFVSRNVTSKFCSVPCKQKNWTENVLHKTEKFIENQRLGNYLSRKRRLIEDDGDRLMTRPEKIVFDILNELDVYFVQEYRACGRYISDFYIPDRNLIIEVFGDYWHSNPRKYGYGYKNLSNIQRKIKHKDSIKLRRMAKEKYSIMIIWEFDAVHLSEEVRQRIIKKIN